MRGSPQPGGGLHVLGWPSGCATRLPASVRSLPDRTRSHRVARPPRDGRRGARDAGSSAVARARAERSDTCRGRGRVPLVVVDALAACSMTSAKASPPESNVSSQRNTNCVTANRTTARTQGGSRPTGSGGVRSRSSSTAVGTCFAATCSRGVRPRSRRGAGSGRGHGRALPAVAAEPSPAGGRRSAQAPPAGEDGYGGCPFRDRRRPTGQSVSDKRFSRSTRPRPVPGWTLGRSRARAEGRPSRLTPR
jgi:hypothetical protein